MTLVASKLVIPAIMTIVQALGTPMPWVPVTSLRSSSESSSSSLSDIFKRLIHTYKLT